MTRLVASALFLALLVLAFEVGRVTALARSAASQPAVSTHVDELAQRTSGAPPRENRHMPDAATGGSGGAPTRTAAVSKPRLVRGTASWGYGWSGVVTRLPRGTRIRVCGALGCWTGRSAGYGPAIWTHRIADLSRAVFAAICGDPAMGLCTVSLERL